MNETFKALVIKQNGTNFTRSIEERNINKLPKGEVLIRVCFSSLNYKDALSSSGDKTVTRHYPHTPGIDAAGIVEFSKARNFKTGDHVVVNSYDLGVNTSGGFGQFIRVPADWVMPLPKGLSLRESMIYGTAGYTAGLSVSLLQDKEIMPGDGSILVTGATGGVGSIAVALLSTLGYSVTASSGKETSKMFLKRLGASKIINREQVIDKMGRTLLKELWSGAIDTVGGKTLETVLKSCKKSGVVVSSGMVSSPKLSITVFPFIIRGISLVGMVSTETSMSKRKEIWSKLAGEWKLKQLDYIAKDCSLEELDSQIDKILIGKQQGRVVVDMRN